MQKLLGNLKTGLFFIVSAPAGAGKTTLVRKLTSEFDCVIESISYTSKEPRKGEVEGKDYFFITKDEFEKKIKNDELLEYANVFDNYYGTSKEFVKKYLNKNKHVVLVIDTQGAMNLKNKIDAIYIFISPTSMDELKTRMLKRNQDSEADIEKRLQWAEKELKLIGNYDYNVTNDDIEKSYQVLKSIFIAEEHKVKNLGEII